VIVTTDKVYEIKDGMHKEGDVLGGSDPYSSSKVCAEHVTLSYIRSFFNPEIKSRPKAFIATARAGNVIGGGDWSRDRLVPDIVRAFFENKQDVVLRNPSSIRPWQHVLDPLHGYLMLAKRLYEEEKEAIGAWNFAPDMDSFITTEDLTRRSISMAGRGGYETRPDAVKPETAVLKLDASKAKKKLNWKPLLEIDETLEWTFQWYNSYYSGNNAKEFTDAQISNFMKRAGHG
jgi:CDP-glucose 4,6-dehydratase